jgi:hypothetical protein
VAAGFLTRSQTEERVRSLARPGSGAQSWSLRIALWMPPTSSHSSPLGPVLATLARFVGQLGDEMHVPLLLLSTAARDPGVQLLAPCLIARSAR